VLYQCVILKHPQGGGLGSNGAVKAQKKSNGKGNVNFPLEQAMKAQKGNISTSNNQTYIMPTSRLFYVPQQMTFKVGYSGSRP